MNDISIIFDNVIFSLQRAGGISLYWYELLKGTSENYKNVTHVTYKGEIDNLYHSQLTRLNASSLYEKFPIEVVRFLPYRGKINTPAIFHSSYFRYCYNAKVANIITVYDLTYEKYLNSFLRKPHLWQRRSSLRKAEGIICISESTKSDLVTLYPEVAHKKIKVIPLGVSDSFCITKGELINGDINEILYRNYALYIGSRASYKNFDVAVDAVEAIPDLNLLIVGGGELSNHEIIELERKLKKRYFHVQGINEYDLNILYNNAFCLLYPSSYEGFGLPLLEAMSAGCPVISVNISSIPEVCGAAALLIEEPTAELAIDKLIELRNGKFREAIISKGINRAKKFNWSRCVEQTHSFYSQIFNKNF